MKFKNNTTYFPITPKQFEELTNEILVAVNTLTAPEAVDSRYMAQVVTAALHGFPRTEGIVDKAELFKSVINRMSNNLTFKLAEAIQEEILKEAELAKQDTQGLSVVPPQAELEPSVPAGVTEH